MLLLPVVIMFTLQPVFLQHFFLLLNIELLLSIENHFQYVVITCMNANQCYAQYSLSDLMLHFLVVLHIIFFFVIIVYVAHLPYSSYSLLIIRISVQYECRVCAIELDRPNQLNLTHILKLGVGGEERQTFTLTVSPVASGKASDTVSQLLEEMDGLRQLADLLQIDYDEDTTTVARIGARMSERCW